MAANEEGDGISARKRLSSSEHKDSDVSTKKKKYTPKGQLYECKPVSESVREAARQATIGSTWWKMPKLSEAITAVHSLPGKYAEIHDRSLYPEDVYKAPNPMADDVLNIEPDVATCLMLTNPREEEPKKAKLLQGYLLSKYCRGVVQFKQNHFDCGLVALLSQIKGWQDDELYSSQHLRRHMVLHMCQKPGFFQGKCKQYLIAQNRSIYEWCKYMLKNTSFLDMVAFIVLRDMIQVPISLVSPGPLPRTRLKVDSVVASGHDTVLWDKDLKSLTYMGIPIVIAWNGRHHFSSTMVADPVRLNEFKVSVMAGLLQCMEEAITDVNPDLLNATASGQLNVLKKSVADSKAIFVGDKAQFTSVEKLTGAKPGAKATAAVPPAPMKPVDEPEVTEATASTSGAKAKRYKCKDQLCMETFSRTGQRDLHMFRAHGIGKGWFCKVEGCKDAIAGKCFAGQSSLNTHHRTLHENVWKYICEKPHPNPEKKGKCGWRTDNYDAVPGHDKNTHGEGPSHECPHCGKDTFGSEQLLNKHLKSQSCLIGKNFICDFGTCKRAYKTQGGLNIHKRVHDPNYTGPDNEEDDNEEPEDDPEIQDDEPDDN